MNREMLEALKGFKDAAETLLRVWPATETRGEAFPPSFMPFRGVATEIKHWYLSERAALEREERESLTLYRWEETDIAQGHHATCEHLGTSFEDALSKSYPEDFGDYNPNGGSFENYLSCCSRSITFLGGGPEPSKAAIAEIREILFPTGEVTPADKMAALTLALNTHGFGSGAQAVETPGHVSLREFWDLHPELVRDWGGHHDPHNPFQACWVLQMARGNGYKIHKYINNTGRVDKPEHDISISRAIDIIEKGDPSLVYLTK